VPGVTRAGIAEQAVRHTTKVYHFRINETTSHGESLTVLNAQKARALFHSDSSPQSANGGRARQRRARDDHLGNLTLHAQEAPMTTPAYSGLNRLGWLTFAAIVMFAVGVQRFFSALY
jgi:hypothetical protein